MIFSIEAIKVTTIILNEWAGAVVKLLRNETYILDAVGSNPSITEWIDIFTLNCCMNCMFCLKKTENIRKRGWGRHIL